VTIEHSVPASTSEEKAKATHGSPTPEPAPTPAQVQLQLKTLEPGTETGVGTGAGSVIKPKPKSSVAAHSSFTNPAELHGRESEPGHEEAHPRSEEAELGREEIKPDREFELPEADSPFPPPGSSSQEILAWWGQRTLKNSRTFAAQREERTHRELLERLRQSLALQTQALQSKASVPNGDLSTASPTQNSHPATGHTLAACLYLTIHCIKCESVRQGRPDYPPSSTVPCPRCGSESSFTVLGAGLTSKPLPFYEVQPTARFSEEGKPRIPWDPLGPLARTKLNDGEE
jgi:hypothetical protein